MSASSRACNECPDAEQLARFSRRMLATGMPASRYVSTFPTWEAALRSVLELPSAGKKLLTLCSFWGFSEELEHQAAKEGVLLIGREWLDQILRG